MDYRNPLQQKAADSCNSPNPECTKTGIQYANISTPVEITPNVKIGELEAEYLGEPDICCVENDCKNSRKIVISQKIRIKIPIQYNVIASIGESSVDCDKPSCK